MKKFLKVVMLVALAMATCPLPHSGVMPQLCVGLLVVALVYFVPVGTRLRWYDHANGSVTVELANGQLGSTVQTADGITGLVITGATQTIGDVTYTAGTPILVTSLSNLAAQGISKIGNGFAYRQIKEFYDTAPEGTPLYVMLAPDTITLAGMADKTNANGAKKLLDYANGKIKVLSILFDPTTDDFDVELEDGLDATVWTAATNMKALTAEYFALQRPFRAIIGSIGYTGDPGDLVDIQSGDNNRVAIMIGDTEASAVPVAAVGLLLGVISTLPVQRKISRVRNGTLNVVEAYLKSTLVDDIVADMSVIAGAGYITWMTYPNQAGYYFSGDPTFSATTDDYHFLARGRIIDKMHVIAYTVFVQEVDDEIPVNTDGKIKAGFCKWLEQQITNQLNNTMVSNGELSSARCFIDPAQNILATNQLNVVITGTPVGYATDIKIVLGFSNPANA